MLSQLLYDTVSIVGVELSLNNTTMMLLLSLLLLHSQVSDKQCSRGQKGWCCCLQENGGIRSYYTGNI
jgi:hypothetical protein